LSSMYLRLGVHSTRSWTAMYPARLIPLIQLLTALSDCKTIRVLPNSYLIWLTTFTTVSRSISVSMRQGKTCSQMWGTAVYSSLLTLNGSSWAPAHAKSDGMKLLCHFSKYALFSGSGRSITLYFCLMLRGKCSGTRGVPLLGVLPTVWLAVLLAASERGGC